MAQGAAQAGDIVLTSVDNSAEGNGFVIERTVLPDCWDGWEVIGYTGANRTSFTDTLVIGACYRVAAFNEHGVSKYSNIAQVDANRGLKIQRNVLSQLSPENQTNGFSHSATCCQQARCSRVDKDSRECDLP